MKKLITLKNIKYLESKSKKTRYYRANVYYMGKCVGAVRNNGQGDCDIHTVTYPEGWEAMQEHIKELAAINTDMDNTYPQDLNRICSELLDIYIASQQMKKILSHRLVYKPDGMDEINVGKAAPNVWVKNEWVDEWVASNPKDMILNKMTLEDAIELYNKYPHKYPPRFIISETWCL